jgi:hypothetical protein
MNVVKLMGGLGNQLFQYAFGRVVEECSGNKTGYDVSWYKIKRVPPRPYLLDQFQMVVPSTNYQNTRKFSEKLGEAIPSLHVDDTYFSGYWQNSDLYSPSLLEEFREKFHVKPSLYTPAFLQLREQVQGCTSVALHVRRGDYLMHPNHLVLPIRYYQNALSYMHSLKKNVEVFIFSDDIEWCQDNFMDCHFVELENESLEFDLMRSCKHFIIANSTFSWWAAYLSLNAAIIGPKKWWRSSVNGYAVYERRMQQVDWLNISLS